jgi:predicted extracellular nuclease
MPVLDVGARVGAVSGVFSYGFGNFELLPTARPTGDGESAPRDSTTLEGDRGHVTVATYNVENLAPEDAADGRFARIADDIVHALARPDVVALQEIQDGSGAEDDGVVEASRTYEALVRAIVDAGGPRYGFTDIAPVDGADGGAPGGNIRVGFLYRADRVALHPSEHGRGEALDATRCVPGPEGVALTHNPGRIAPVDSAFRASRKSLVAHFDFRDQSFFVVNDHFGSKLGGDALFGRVQPPVDPREGVRTAQAEAVAAFVDELRTIDPNAVIVVLGDLNAFGGSGPLVALERGAGLVDLAEAKLPPTERYGYLYEGNAQALDHVLVPEALAGAAELEIIHINAEYADAVSDHDPEVLRLGLGHAERAAPHASRRRHRCRFFAFFALLALLFGFPSGLF